MLEEKYGIFEDENGELFIESDVVEYVMDEYDLYEEDAMDLIMEAYEEELLIEESKKIRNAAIGGGALLVAGGALAAHKAYKNSKHYVDSREKKVKKAAAKVNLQKDIRRTMDDVEKSRIRTSGGYRTVTNSDGSTYQVPNIDSNYGDATRIAKERVYADGRIKKAEEKHSKAVKDYEKAKSRYDRLHPQPQPEKRRRFGRR